MKKVNYDCYVCGTPSVKFRTDILKSSKKKEYKYIDENGFSVSGRKCIPCFRKATMKHRIETKNKSTHKYEKTKKGFLMRLYRNMKSRITGVQSKKHHLYKGKSLLEKNDFYSWALKSKDFHELFDIWEKSKYEQTLTPSVDRILFNKGYELENMRWVTFSENCKNVQQ
jgi:hypothetical protein